MKACLALSYGSLAAGNGTSAEHLLNMSFGYPRKGQIVNFCEPDYLSLHKSTKNIVDLRSSVLIWVKWGSS